MTVKSQGIGFNHNSAGKSLEVWFNTDVILNSNQDSLKYYRVRVSRLKCRFQAIIPLMSLNKELQEKGVGIMNGKQK